MSVFTRRRVAFVNDDMFETLYYTGTYFYSKYLRSTAGELLYHFSQRGPSDRHACRCVVRACETAEGDAVPAHFGNLAEIDLEEP